VEVDTRHYAVRVSICFVCSKICNVNDTQDVNAMLLLCCVQGVKFMYDCVTGKQIEGSTGCIMADEMVMYFYCALDKFYKLDKFFDKV